MKKFLFFLFFLPVARAQTKSLGERSSKLCKEMTQQYLYSLEKDEVDKYLKLMNSCLKSSASQDFLVEREEYITEASPTFWESIKLFKGSVKAPQKNMLAKCMRPDASWIEKISMALHFATPVNNPEILNTEQTIVRVFENNAELNHCMTEEYNRLSAIELGLLFLFKRDKDSFWGEDGLMGTLKKEYPNKEGKFTSWFKIECFRQLWKVSKIIELGVTFSGLYKSLYVFYSYTMAPKLVKNKFELIQILWSTLICIVLLCLGIHFLVIEMAKEKISTNLLIKKLSFIQELFEISQNIDQLIRSNPTLEVACAHKLKFTRQLLTGTHKNANYNKLANIFLNNDFKNWDSSFFNYFSTILITLTQLEDNVDMIGELLFELGRVSISLSAVHLIQNPNKHRNGFAYVEFLSQPNTYIDLKGSWNINMEAEEVIPHNMLLDANKANTCSIVGPNGCGKSNTCETDIANMLLAQTLGIVAADQARVTPVDYLFAFKEPKEEQGDKMSLFTKELDILREHNDILKMCNATGKKSLTYYDELLSSTGPIESAVLQNAIISNNIAKYPNNINIVSTHNPYLIKSLLKNKKAMVMHVVIDRHPDRSYTPCYTIAPGATNEKVGIDLYEKIIGDKEVVQKAREEYEKISRLQV